MKSCRGRLRDFWVSTALLLLDQQLCTWQLVMRKRFLPITFHVTFCFLLKWYECFHSYLWSFFLYDFLFSFIFSLFFFYSIDRRGKRKKGKKKKKDTIFQTYKVDLHIAAVNNIRFAAINNQEEEYTGSDSM